MDADTSKDLGPSGGSCLLQFAMVGYNGSEVVSVYNPPLRGRRRQLIPIPHSSYTKGHGML